MATPIAVVNDFPQHRRHTRRNTRSSNWTAADSKRPVTHQQAGPYRTTHFETQQPQHVSHIAVWSQLGMGKSANDEVVSPNISDHSPPTSPIYSGRALCHNDPVPATSHIVFTPPGEAMKNPNITGVPYQTATIKPSETKPKQAWWRLGFNPSTTSFDTASGRSSTSGGKEIPNFRHFLHEAKAIYKTGPEGEGQEVWHSYLQFRKQKYAETRQDTTELPTSRLPVAPFPQLPAAGLSKYPPLRSRHSTVQRNNISESVYLRQDCTWSKETHFQSSRNMPIAINANIQQAVDVNKPLPPVPQLQPAPKAQRSVAEKNANWVGIATVGKQHPTMREGHVRRTECLPSVWKGGASWWRPLTDKQTSKAHNTLKAQISHPIPIMAVNEGRIANAAAEYGGVGGSGATISLAVDRNGLPFNHRDQVGLKQVRPSPPRNVEQHQKSKGKAREDTPPTYWREIFDTFPRSGSRSTAPKGRNRKSSNASFGCQGLPYSISNPYIQDPWPARQYHARKSMDLASHTEYADPETVCCDMSENCDGIRDTRFYQPYHDILSEYRGQVLSDEGDGS